MQQSSTCVALERRFNVELGARVNRRPVLGCLEVNQRGAVSGSDRVYSRLVRR